MKTEKVTKRLCKNCQTILKYKTTISDDGYSEYYTKWRYCPKCNHHEIIENSYS